MTPQIQLGMRIDAKAQDPAFVFRYAELFHEFTMYDIANQPQQNQPQQIDPAKVWNHIITHTEQNQPRQPVDNRVANVQQARKLTVVVEDATPSWWAD